jgi:hypothetical protein
VSNDRLHPSRITGDAEARPWTPPVNEEFERYGQAYFISVTPRFMPRWLVHADLSNLAASDAATHSHLQWIRPVALAFATVATWCLRKAWTVSVERRDVAGAGNWRYVLCEEYRSIADAQFRRNAIVDGWRDVLLPDWRAGDFAPLPFLDDGTEDRHDTNRSS